MQSIDGRMDKSGTGEYSSVTEWVFKAENVKTLMRLLPLARDLLWLMKSLSVVNSRLKKLTG